MNIVDPRETYDLSGPENLEPGKLQDADLRYPSGEPDESEATVETEIMGNPMRVEGNRTVVRFSKAAHLVKRDGKWALVSKSDPSKVLKWFGTEKPSNESLAKEERRVEFFKHQGGLGVGLNDMNRELQTTPMTERPFEAYQSYSQFEGDGKEHMGSADPSLEQNCHTCDEQDHDKEALFRDEHTPIQIDNSAFDYVPDVPGHDSRGLSYEQNDLTEPLTRSPFIPLASWRWRS